jgi:suppressor of ftsI
MLMLRRTLMVVALLPLTAAAQDMSGMDMPGMHLSDTSANRMPPMPKDVPMMQDMVGAGPRITPYLPHATDASSVHPAVPSTVVAVRDGDTLNLEAGLVRRTINGRTFVMYGFNGQYPGPMIRVKQQATITVRFTNHLDWPSSVHWHGIRLDNKFDGAVGVTQDAVPPGGTFTYTVHVPDAGLYWYHPHVREDIEQNLGLYGNLLVDSPEADYYSPANAEQALILSDILIDKQGLFPYGKDVSDFSIMGRFGNVMLVNGEPHYTMAAHKGDVVRLMLTNVSNTRSFNLSLPGARLKLVATDVSRYEHEQMINNVTIVPAERYIVDARFDSAGTFALTNRVQALNNFAGEYAPEVDTLAIVTVDAHPSATSYAKAFETLRTNAEVVADIARFKDAFNKAPDRELELTVNIQGLPTPLVAFMSIDTMYYSPVEWNDGMPDMNWVSTAKQVRWIMRDKATGKEDMDVDWHFKKGDMVKIRIHNDPQSMHPMGHPLHFHGQRFLVIARDGVPNPYLAWKDTELIPVGETVDVLLDASNPGRWMAHCHIAEHLEAGMHLVFTVDP